MAKPKTRKIKWVGDPAILKSDGWSVYNWDYENKRVIAVVGHTQRAVSRKDLPGLSKDYHWGGPSPSHYVVDADDIDAHLILSSGPQEFKDVTDHPNPDSVLNDTYIVKRDEATGALYRELARVPTLPA
jgi:hypothetical protein